MKPSNPITVAPDLILHQEVFNSLSDVSQLKDCGSDFAEIVLENCCLHITLACPLQPSQGESDA